MIGIVIMWVITGIVLIILSISMYNYNILNLLNFLAFILLGILVLLANTILFKEWQNKKRLRKPYSEEMKNMYIKVFAVSIIIFGLGVVGYLLGILGVYNSNIPVINTLLSLFSSNQFLKLAAGLFGAIGSILSWVYVDRYGIRETLNEITRQQRKLEYIKDGIKQNRTKLESKMDDLNKLRENAKKIEEKAKEELVG